MANVYHFGTSVRLMCSFYNFEGKLVDPDTVKVIIYNNKYEIVKTEFVDKSNNISVGVYYFDYLTDRKESRYFYEWYGEIDGNPSLKRGQFSTKFV